MLVGDGARVNVFTHLTVCSFSFSSAHCGRYLSDTGPQTVCQVQKAKRCRYLYNITKVGKCDDFCICTFIDVIGMDEVLAHYTCTFKNSDLHFHFQ